MGGGELSNAWQSTIKGWFASMPASEKSDVNGEVREMWPSRASFLLAAIGSSVGLGNIWRFPALAYKFGGGAFFVPYFLALFIIGIPILALELALGKLFRSGDVVCFSRISHRLRGLGLASVFGAFIVNTYYAVLLGWIIVYFFRSFNPTLPWLAKDPMAYFNEDILMVPTDGRTSDPYMIVGHTLGATILVWLTMYFSLWKGVGLTGKIVYFTMTMPVILIIVLFVRGVTLPGASAGIHDYIGHFDAAKLSDPLIWSEAIGQIFFSIGVAFGTMTAYASYNSKHQNPAMDSFIVAISNSVYEIFCGFVVFSTIGYLRTVVKEKEVAVGSFGLAFGTYPLAFSTLPGAQFWNALFFLKLFILGIDSGFSLIESGATVLMDSRTFKGKSREATLAAMCFAGFLVSILFCTEVGIYAMDAVDYFLNNVAICFVGLMECVGAGFFYRFYETRDRVGLWSILTFNITFSLALIVGLTLAYTVSILIGACSAAGLLLLGVLAALFAVRDKSMSWKSRFWWITMSNIELLRRDINETSMKGSIRLPMLWSIAIKYMCVPILFVILSIPFNQMSRVVDTKVPSPYRWLGILVAGVSVAFVFIGFFIPRWFNWLMPTGEEDAEVIAKQTIDETAGDIEMLAAAPRGADDSTGSDNSTTTQRTTAVE